MAASPESTVRTSEWMGADAPRLGGVSYRLARRLGAHPLVVRAGFVVLALTGGLGVVLYGACWFWLGDAGDETRRSPSTRGDVAIVCLVLAALLAVDAADLGLPMALLGLLALVLMGFAVASAAGVTGAASDSMLQAAPVRAAIGGILVVIAVALGLSQAGDVANVWTGFIALVALVIGLGIVMAPWLRRLAATTEYERSERIRAEQRADIASHLHDSVLQTLTLIQNRADEPNVVAALAHQQERDLRRWLYRGEVEPGPATTLAGAVEAMAEQVEGQYEVPIEVIVIGDLPLDADADAVLGATREALVNAVRHSGADEVAIFADISSADVAVFVRDRGCGFVVDAVDDDRHGIRQSIIARMERIGGTASVRSSDGQGTEVALRYCPTPIGSGAGPEAAVAGETRDEPTEAST